jgi:tetratricopeptide (TPR) repeat protein
VEQPSSPLPDTQTSVGFGFNANLVSTFSSRRLLGSCVVKPSKPRYPVLQRFYQRYLEEEVSAAFIKIVAEHYTTATLERLAEYGHRESRRAATLALGFLADFPSNAVLGRRLRDPDRGVRILAENAIRQVWCRDGSDAQRVWLRTIIRLNDSGQAEAALQEAIQLIDQAPYFAEAWNQRAIAQYRLECFSESISDCHRALELNPYHFAAAVGMAHCHLRLDDGHTALACFRRALRLNPGLDRVRAHVAYLKRTLKKK